MATESKHVFAALCEGHLGRRRLTGNEARPKQRICAAVSNDVLGMGRPLRPERQGCQRQGHCGLLAIGMRAGGSDFHYGKRCVHAS
jgi:hypothetical protein